MFTVHECLPGIYHTQDCMGVCFTLITGSERALLVDTGYGLEDVGAWVRSVTSLPVTVLLTHGHHDHALGARWFSEICLFPEEEDVYRTYTGPVYRQRVADQARAKGLEIPDGFMDARFPEPALIRENTLDLGGIRCQIMRVPGHTPGSAMVLIPEAGLLLTGDNWNPCTWLFFPEAMPLRGWLTQMRRLFSEGSFTRVLCSHRTELWPREVPERFFAALTEERLASAVPVPLWPDPAIDPCRCDADEEQYIVFDRNKLEPLTCSDTEGRKS